jgi:uncharacterized membrane protein YhaH (DUF805 family)
VGLWIVATLLFEIYMLAPTATVAVRRLHDFDFGGYWFVVAVVLYPLLLPLVLVLLTVPGKKGPNRYGPDPREGFEEAEPSAELRAPAVRREQDLRFSPGWESRLFWVLLMVSVAVVVLGLLGFVRRFATG